MTTPGESTEVEFEWRGLSVTGQFYAGCEEDGFADDFHAENISLGDQSLPDFIQEWICEKHYEDLFAKAQETANG